MVKVKEGNFWCATDCKKARGAGGSVNIQLAASGKVPVADRFWVDESTLVGDGGEVDYPFVAFGFSERISTQRTSITWHG